MEPTFLGIFHARLKVETEAALKSQRTPGADNLTIFDAGQALALTQAKKHATAARRKPLKRHRVADLPEVQGKFL